MRAYQGTRLRSFIEPSRLVRPNLDDVNDVAPVIHDAKLQNLLVQIDTDEVTCYDLLRSASL